MNATKCTCRNSREEASFSSESDSTKSWNKISMTKLRHLGLTSLLLLGACSAHERAEDAPPPLAQRWAELTVSGVQATVALQNDWGSGYCAEVHIENTSSTSISGWQVEMNFRQSAVSSVWSGSQSGNFVSGLDYNSSLAPGASAQFGFCADATGSDYLPTVSGLSVTGGNDSGTGGGSSTGGAQATGGTQPTGGNTGTGGSSSTGGSAATGGATSTGGNTGTGGSSSTGGSAATGGATPTGGSSNTGGSLATGGAAPTGGSSNTGATLSIDNDWGSGYCATVNPDAGGSWTVVIDLHNSEINNLWNGNLAAAGSTATVSGDSDSFGFCARSLSSSNYLPSITSVNGGSVGTGGSSSSGGSTSTGGAASGGSTGSGGTTSTGGSSGNPDPIGQGCDGYATRFWDCCKPHCGWSGNVPGGVGTMNSCSADNQQLFSSDEQSACNGGQAHTCYGLAPYAVNNTLAYGYAATASGDVCGRCYQLDFDGTSHNAGNDPGSAALNGKTMIVQAINIGFDVGGGQFDLLIPGGGVGAFNACSAQWGVSNSELGAQYGGFLTACKAQYGGNASHDTYKNCMRNKCESVFGSRGLNDLAAGCNWFVDWFEAADNPSLKYKEVACPAALSGDSGMDRSGLNDISNACGN